MLWIENEHAKHTEDAVQYMPIRLLTQGEGKLCPAAMILATWCCQHWEGFSLHDAVALIHLFEPKA